MAKAFIDRELGVYAGRVDVAARALHTPAESVASEAVEVMSSYGLDISNHQPTRVNAAEIETADVILVADQDLLKDATHYFPEASGRVFRFMDFATGEPSDVRDPIGDVGEYLVAARRLHRAGQVV